MLFVPELNGWESWGNVFCSIDVFTPLIYEILNREKLIVNSKPENLTPGSNAVFRIDNMVVKIYAPKESGMDTEYDYNVEILTIERANRQGVSVPKILAKGEIHDKYLFRYIIMEYKASDLSMEDILSLPLDKKRLFAEKVKYLVTKLNQPIETLVKSINSKSEEEKLNRMKGLNAKLIEELVECSTKASSIEYVLVHGDITRDNIIINKDLDITLIDFADCVQAPCYYELPGIVFELFMCDRELVSSFVGDENREKFLDLLIEGLALHSYCGYILKDYFKRVGAANDAVDNITTLKEILQKQFF